MRYQYIPTDGEVRRENYFHYHCRHFNGIDFDNLTQVRERLIAAPDCGLGLLGRDLAMQKPKIMCDVAKSM